MNSFKPIFKCVFFGLIWTLVSFCIALGIKSFTAYNLQDILFVEGMILIGLAILSSVSGNSNGLSLSGLGQSNAQYVMSANLEVTKKERSINNLKADFKMGLSSMALVLGGVFSIVLNFLV